MARTDRPTPAPENPDPVAAAEALSGVSRSWWIGAVLVVSVFLAYQPVWFAGFIWDDDGHLTKAFLRPLSGLALIWGEPGTTQQYYPLTHSLFWLLRRLFDLEPSAYHLCNIALHATNVLLLWRVLRRLRLPGAALAAAVFALHPVMVESVAWISEIKNTLSALLYFCAALAYLRYDRERRPGHYLPAFLLFLAALFAKTVTASLPAALLVVFWWQRGRLDWRRDVVPLLPFFAAGAMCGLFTARVEHDIIGASGDDFDFSLVERGLIAGRALWFYAGKLAWPVDLVFVYPRWDINGADPAQYAWPIAAVVVGVVLVWLARRWRGPLAGALFFGGTLFPVLGFLNVYPFQFSFVADHFQYLASLGLIVPVAAGLARLRGIPGVMTGAGAALVASLGFLTFAQSRNYADVVALYTHAIERNPKAMMAHVNLANLHLMAAQIPEAIEHYQAAIRLRPRMALLHFDLGTAYALQGRRPEAIAEFETTLRLDPGYVKVNLNLGSALAEEGRLREACGYLRVAANLMPGNADARRGLGRALFELGHHAEAVVQLREALRLNPRDPLAKELLQLALGRPYQPEAVRQGRSSK